MTAVRGRAPRARRGGVLLALLAVGLVSCAKTFLIVRVEDKGHATLTLMGGTLELAGPGDLTFVCRTWGDSYFQVWQGTNTWTCSGGQLSDNGVKFGGVVVDAAVRAAAASMGVGAAGTGVSLLMDALGQAHEAQAGTTPGTAPDPAPEVAP